MQNIYQIKTENIKSFLHNHSYSYGEFENNIEKFIEFIYSIIDECDSMIIFYNNGYEIKYTEHLKYEVYDNIEVNYNRLQLSNKKVYNIIDDIDKSFVKKNIKFNLSDESRHPMCVNTTNLHIENDTNLSKNNAMTNIIYFIKNDTLLYYFIPYNGYIYDFRTDKNI